MEDIIKTNKSVKEGDVRNPVGVFVGGTSGVGEYTAYKFAEYTTSPTIYIVGRNETAGETVLKKLRELNSSPDANYYFVKKDITLIKECDKLCENINEKESKLNLLFLTSGFLTFNGRTENAEGNDTKLAVNYYGRWRIVQKLMPLLSSAAENKEPTRVVSVLQPGNEGPVDEDDLDLKNKFTLLKANRHIVEFNSLAVSRFGKLYPNISFIHANPGAVDTGILRELPWAVRSLGGFFGKFVATDSQTSAEKFFYLGYSSAEFKSGAHIVDSKLKEMLPSIEKKGFLSSELQEKVWDHTEKLFSDSLTK